ncbi:AarF/UbiB family protein [Endozoicomonas sp. ONNA2]|uniref:AarF/UbiB family protein n=1 Tax=Endozoicomonas sp. ONNA2 TaxID=2828741 RepID=UPI002147F913|nr:AarF/UbiB family protein [Endozoicomonas sp. ONNA2]
MDTHMEQHPPGLYDFQPPVKPSTSSGASVESTFQGRQVTEYQGESSSLKEEKQSTGTRAWSSIKSIPREISIFCRAVGKVTLIAYYCVKHTLFGREFTSQHMQSYLQRLGSAYPKMLQMVVANPHLLTQMVNALNMTEAESDKLDGVIRDVLDNNPEIPISVPRSILDKAGYKDHSVERHIATGTIGSCFEVKKDEESLVAKVIPDWKANDLAAGLKSIRMLLFIMPKEIRMTIREMTDPFIRECNLKQEKNNLTAFKETLEKTAKEVEIEADALPTSIKLNFKVPKITEAVDADNLLIMEYLQDGFTLNTLTSPANQQLRSEVYEWCFGEPPEDDDDCEYVLDIVHSIAKEKWLELALKHGMVHGDCHPGNIMVTFKPGGHIDVWFIDFGNCVTLTPAQRTQYPDVVRQLSNLVNPFVTTPLDQTGVDRLVDTLWDEVAISHRANTPEKKEKFKSRLIEDLNELRDLDKVIQRFPVFQRLVSRANLQDPKFQRELKIQILSLVSARLSACCLLEGIQLPPSFTHYINAHFRAGVILLKARKPCPGLDS